mmetsp:Transcript_21569/g.52546  ORF Transcript_21569/g.52546 Transcript_21569/m.52546 type:complete len:297 (-) Transcript_21569:271-1161(-)
MWSHLAMDSRDHGRRRLILQQLLQGAASRLLLGTLHYLAFEVVPHRSRDPRVGTGDPPLAQASLGPLRSKTVVEPGRVRPCGHCLHLGQIRQSKPKIGHCSLRVGQCHHQRSLPQHGLLGQQIKSHSESKRRIQSGRRRHVGKQIQVLWCRQRSRGEGRHGSQTLGQRRRGRRHRRKTRIRSGLPEARCFVHNVVVGSRQPRWPCHVSRSAGIARQHLCDRPHGQVVGPRAPLEGVRGRHVHGRVGCLRRRRAQKGARGLPRSARCGQQGRACSKGGLAAERQGRSHRREALPLLG